VTRTKVSLYLAITAAGLSLILGLAFNHEYQRMLLPLALGVLWVFALYQKWVWGPSICAFGLLLFASILHSVSEIWLWLCLLTSLIAWDLSYFLFDIQSTEFIRQGDKLEWDHIKRLAAVIGLSFVFLLISRELNLNLRFGWVLVLGLIIIFGLSRVILLVRESPSHPPD
jgi:hypothetical protein